MREQGIPTISVVLPAFNEGRRLRSLLEELVETGSAVATPVVEFIVSDDGSELEDYEAERAAVAWAEAAFLERRAPHRLRTLRAERNEGKGGAILRGWSEAAAGSTWLAFLDADGAVGGNEFWRLARKVNGSHDVDVLAASRVRMAGKRVERDPVRHYQGRVFATLVELFFRLGFYDTQCGLKFFRSSFIRPNLDLVRERGWSVDVELLALAREAGATFREEPIDWADPGGSKVRFGIDAVKMAWALERIRRRMKTNSALIRDRLRTTHARARVGVAVGSDSCA